MSPRSDPRTSSGKILLVCPQRIGDVLLATPLARALKRAWPQARLDMLVFADTAAVLEGNPDVDAIVTVARRAPWRQRWRELARLWRNYDLALSPLPTDRARLYCFAAARRRLGLLRAEFKDSSKAWLLSAHGRFDDVGTHTVAMGLALGQLAGIAPAFTVVPPRPPSAPAEALRQRLQRFAPSGYAVLHPAPKFAYKMWPSDAWVTLGQWLQDQGVAVAFTGGAAPEELDYVRAIAAALPAATCLDLAGSLSLAECAELIAGAKLYVGPDTAMTHIAAATGTPTIALFGPSNPVKWGPWPADWASLASPWEKIGSARQGNVFLLQGEDPRGCVPCREEGCERRIDSRSACLDRLAPATVIAAAAAMIAG